jgi:uncharacterized delta-60 repeat protein
VTFRLLIALVAALAATAAAPATAGAAVDPTLTADGGFATRADAGALSGAPHAVAVSGDRIYQLGEAAAAGGGLDIGIVARHADGTLDTGFAGDGRLTLSVAAPARNDRAADLVVLPDGHLRIAGSTDVATGGAERDDVLLAGLRPDGSRDPGFGANGIATFPATGGTADDAATAIALAPDGRLAVAGNTGTSDAFVTVRDADGSPATGFGGVRSLAGARAAGIAWRPDGTVAALLQRASGAVLHAFTAAGTDDTGFGAAGGELVLPLTPPATAGGLIADGGRLYAAGSSGDEAYLARVTPAGDTVDSRRFEMRGAVGPATPVTTTGSDLDVIGGPVSALVVAGSITTGGSSSPVWAAAAFNDFDGPLASAPMGSVVDDRGVAQDASPAIAAGTGFAAVGGQLGGSRYGLSKLLLDRCDLAVSVPAGRVTFAGRRPTAITLRVDNEGTRACGGTISAPAPYSFAQGPVATPTIAPGSTFTADAQLAYGGALKPKDQLAVTLDAPEDADVSDNTATVPVDFRYCDLELRVASMSAMPTEGARRIPISVRNLGTTACRRITVAVGRGGRRTDRDPPYTLRGGHSAADSIPIARHGGTVGRTLAVRWHVATASNDLRTSNDTVTRRPALVRVGDTSIRTVSARAVAGVASRGRGHLALRRLRVSRVDVAIRRLDVTGCRWVGGTSGALVSRAKRRGTCVGEVWIRAKRTARWGLTLGRALAPGRYEVRSRATIGAGLQEARFGAADRNLRRVTIR